MMSVLGGCASARMSDREPDRLFRQARYDEAAVKLNEGVKDQGLNGRDLLLYLLDLGLVLHTEGKYKESNQIFFQADKIAEIKDYTSLTTEGASLLVSDNITDYKGEDFEKVLISMYLSLNYALMGDHENAIVESRRVNRKLLLMVTEGERKYKQNAFARYLSAVLYEADGNWNDAYIDYKSAAELMPSYAPLGRDLWRMAYLDSMQDQADEWAEKYEIGAEEIASLKALYPRRQRRAAGAVDAAPKGEIVVIYENGISPIKRPNPNYNAVPRFYPRYNPVLSARILLNGVDRAETSRLDDIETTAIENLEDKWGGLIAKKIGGGVAKVAAGVGVAKLTNSPLLGYIASRVLFLADEADLRSWNLLPKDLQIARIPVDAGKYMVRCHPIGDSDLPEREVTVAAGQKVFVNFRYAPR